MGETIFIWIFVSGFMGFIGLFLGQQVNKMLAGFVLGAFLGPIGWIVVFLLPRNNEHKEEQIEISDQPLMERDLSNDAYKIWLVARYKIEKNETLGQFVCSEKLFDSVGEALSFANQLEQDKLAEQKGQEKLRLKRMEEAKQALLEREKEDEEKRQQLRDGLRKLRPLLFGVLAFIVVVGSISANRQIRQYDITLRSIEAAEDDLNQRLSQILKETEDLKIELNTLISEYKYRDKKNHEIYINSKEDLQAKIQLSEFEQARESEQLKEYRELRPEKPFAVKVTELFSE